MIEFDTPRRASPEINLSALIDVSFILVIFIVLAASFSRTRALGVELPQAEANSKPEREALVVTVPAAGPVRVGEIEVPIEEVRAVLERERGEHTSLLLVADRTAAMERAVRVLGDAEQAGFTSVAIATAPVREPAP